MGGYDLVALVFVREVSDPLTGLVKQIDQQLEEASARRPGPDKLGVFVIFCNDDPAMKDRLRELVARERLKHVVLCSADAQGPPRYKVAKEADYTVVIYKNSEDVASNFALRKGELNEERAKDIRKALAQVLPR